MICRPLLVTHTGPRGSRAALFCRMLGLAVVLAPSLAHAQATGSITFKDIIFIERGILSYPNPNDADTSKYHNEADGFHFIDEYFGHNGRKGGGLFILKDFQSSNPQKVDIVAGLNVPAGKVNAGQTLSSGTFLSPDLSYDGKTVVFAWSSGGTEKFTAKNRFHLFKVDIDGKNLVQLSDGDFDDFHPAWMPNGRIIFVSTRRGGYGRCHERPVPTYTLHSMKDDGTDIIRLSYHETNEFHPSIANDGRIVYMRWDYIDRDFNAAHHIWFCNPDGSNPRSWGGNYVLPLDTMGSGPWTDGRYTERPFAEFYPRAIPGAATKYVAVAGPHHAEAYGTLIIRDYSKVDDNGMGQVTKLTPDVAFPESKGGALTYGPAWPLSETLFLTSYNNTMVLLDTSTTPAKRTELYKTSDASLRPLYAMPLAARTPPPVITEGTYQGERWSPAARPATVQVSNVYVTDTYGKLPDGVKITSMRIVQVLPKTTQLLDDPRLGYSSENVAKMVLGTVPVESDGSVFFEAPIGKEILFQVLDANGMAVQTMRSGTYLHPGENMTCTGCHEDKMAAPPTGGTPSASLRPASKLEPELGRVEPINYARYISPILTKKCFPCHQGTNAPTNAAYSAMEPYSFWFAGNISNTVAKHGGSRSKPGMIGARGSRMGKALLDATHQKAQADGTYNDTDVRTLVQWLDLGSDELGSFDNQNAQRQGQVVWPTLDVDKNDPQGLTYKPETPYVERKDAGSSGPDLPQADGPAPSGTGGATSSGGNTSGGNRGTGGTVSSGGQSGSGSQTTPTGGAGGAAGGGSGGAGGSGTQGTVASGGQPGSGGTGKPSPVASGGQPGSGGATGTRSTVASGGQPGSGGGTGTRSTGSSGGQSGSGGTSAVRSTSGLACSMGANPSAPAGAWILFVIGSALLVRNRRKP
jgi:hypothetical protein